MHSKGHTHHSMLGMSWNPTSVWFTILLMLLFFIFLLLFLTLTVQTAQGQTYRAIYNFTGGANGAGPITGLTMDAAGNLYGTTVWGGTSGCDGLFGCGTVFRLSPTGTGWFYSRLYSFNWGDGSGPDSRVVFGPDGSLYGATASGGGRGGGTIFKLTPTGNTWPNFLAGWTETVLYSFVGRDDGDGPWGDIMVDQSGFVYGATIIGGTHDCGTIYELWAGQKSTLHSFSCPPDGNGPEAGVIIDAAGRLAGTTATGGLYQFGTVYELTPPGDIVRYNFQPGATGYLPLGELIKDQSGNLYGTTSHGGLGGGGTVFMLTPSWDFTVLYSFTGYGGPSGTLAMDAEGNLYGTTGAGGTYSAGNVYKLTRWGSSWIYTSLHDFSFGEDGGAPQGGVTLDANGNIFGTTKYGGWFGPGCETYGCGVVWEIMP